MLVDRVSYCNFQLGNLVPICFSNNVLQITNPLKYVRNSVICAVDHCNIRSRIFDKSNVYKYTVVVFERNITCVFVMDVYSIPFSAHTYFITRCNRFLRAFLVLWSFFFSHFSNKNIHMSTYVTKCRFYFSVVHTYYVEYVIWALLLKIFVLYMNC